MAACGCFLFADEDKIIRFSETAKPAFIVDLQVHENGKRVVWWNEIYQLVGSAASHSRFEQLMARIKIVVGSLRQGGGWHSAFSSFKQAVSSLCKPFEPTHYKVYQRVQRSLAEIADEYEKVQTINPVPHLLIPQPFIREGLTLSMKGIEVLAARLSKKSKLSNLVVCDSLHALRAKLTAIAADPADARYAFVVPCHQSDVNPCADATVEQHMISVLVEKIQGQLHICLLEPLVDKRLDIAAVERLDLNLSSQQPVRFFPDALVMAYIKQADLNPKMTTLYHTVVRRQFGLNGGCSTFALRDAVNFLKNRAFFQEIQVEDQEELLPCGALKAITTLPPAFMLSMQSVSKLGQYIESHPELAAQKLGKRGLTLQNAVARRTYQQMAVSPGHAPKLLNKYIDLRTAKYQEILLDSIIPNVIQKLDLG